MSAILSLFGWLPAPLSLLFGGALAIFVLVAVFHLIRALIEVLTDLIPGW